MKKEIPASMTHAFERQTHPYHMWEGIQAIPAGLEDILAPGANDAIHASAKAMQAKSAVLLLGCGTSYFAAIAIAHTFQQIVGRPAYAWEAFEFLAYPPPDLANSSLVGISHSGSTPAVVRAVEMARAAGACTLSYTDASPSALSRASEWIIPSTLGLEPALPKTRSYTSALMRGYLQAAELASLDGKPADGWGVALRRAPALTRQIVADSEAQVRSLVAPWIHSRRIIVAGGGPQHATAQEGMLKLTEASMFSSTSWEIEEAVHGIWSSTIEDDLLILLAMEGPSYESALRLAGGMKTIGCKVWVVTNRPWSGTAVDAVTNLPAGEPELLMPLYAIIPIYQFAYFAALAKNLSPDNMRLTDPRLLDAHRQMRSSLP
jgi:glucosamine--fructose-6-phosphate aminotransferase (isomerizing)